MRKSYLKNTLSKRKYSSNRKRNKNSFSVQMGDMVIAAVVVVATAASIVAVVVVANGAHVNSKYTYHLIYHS